MTDHDSGPDIDVSWKDVASYGPVFASVFAFSYVVGYFYAFDIAWFPFFTLTDHLVFALRALPIGIGAFIVMLMSISITIGEHQINSRDHRYLLYLLNVAWVCVLLALAIYSLLENHIGLSFGLLVIAVSTVFFRFINRPISLIVHVLYLGANIAALCMIFGLATGLSWRFHPLARSMHIIRSEQGVGSASALADAAPAGRILFSGSTGVLIYDYNCRRARLARLEDIEEVSECGDSLCSAERPIMKASAECPNPRVLSRPPG